MTKADLEKRVEELERRVKELEAQPRETHTHFHTYPPVYVQPYVPPLIPAWQPTWFGPARITCGDPIPLTTTTANVWGTTTGGVQ